jgi:hypothetical protein
MVLDGVMQIPRRNSPALSSTRSAKVAAFFHCLIVSRRAIYDSGSGVSEMKRLERRLLVDAIVIIEVDDFALSWMSTYTSTNFVDALRIKHGGGHSKCALESHTGVG